MFYRALGRKCISKGVCESSFSNELYFEPMETWRRILPTHQDWNCSICMLLSGVCLFVFALVFFFTFGVVGYTFMQYSSIHVQKTN